MRGPFALVVRACGPVFGRLADIFGDSPIAVVRAGLVVARPLYYAWPNLKLDVRRRETFAEFERRYVGFLQPILGKCSRRMAS